MSKLSKRFRKLPSYLQQVPPELAEQARNANLVAYLTSRGEALKKVGHQGYYYLREHDSLMIRGNYFCWNSRGIEGNPIDFLNQYYGMTFKEAIEELTNTVVSTTEKRLASATNTKQVLETNNFSLPKLNEDTKRTYAYLTKVRCINKSIIQKLLDEKQLMQTEDRNNAFFPWLNKEGKIVGAELQGTLSAKRFKGIASGSAYGYGFHVTIGTPSRMCFFESAIDLLSFWTIYQDKLEDVLMISMAGLKWEVIEGFLNRQPNIKKVYLGVDNDKAGNDFIRAVQAQIEIIPRQPPKQFKDWNDYLKSTAKSQ